MPSILFFADGRDAASILAYLNERDDLAFIVPDGPRDPVEVFYEGYRLSFFERLKSIFRSGDVCMGPPAPDKTYRQRWKSVEAVERLADGEHCLWSMKAGPLVVDETRGRRVVDDPWAGWTEHDLVIGRPHAGNDPSVISLELWTRHRPYTRKEEATLPVLQGYWDDDAERMVASCFSYRDRSAETDAAALRAWCDLENWVAQHATEIGGARRQCGDEDDFDQRYRAFPSALRRLKSGIEYEAHGFNLDRGIREA